MAIGGAFLGGGAEIVPAGYCKLELEILTEDRNNLSATYTIKGTSTYTVTAGTDGRAVYTVPAGQTYTVSVNTTGYDNIASQTVVAESGTVRYVRFEAFEGRVKRSGDTMTGGLTINRTLPAINLKMDNLLVTEKVDTNRYVASLGMLDKSESTKFIGGVRLRWFTSGTHRIGLESMGETESVHGVYVYADPDGTGYAEAPTPSSKTDNSTKIATTAWVNSASTVVHTTGNETISGIKTFTSSPYLTGGQLGYMVKRTDMALGGSWTRYRWDRVKDKNDKDVMELACINDQNTTYTKLVSHNYVDGNDVMGEIRVYVNADGTAYATAPTTPTNATSNEITTADWVNGKLANRVQKLTLKGTLISNGNIIIEPSDIQPNDTVTIAITASSIGATSPITFVMDIPSTVETSTSVRSSSHIVKGSDGKVYSISLFGMYQQTVGWEITITKLSIADGARSSLAITSFYGHILRG